MSDNPKVLVVGSINRDMIFYNPHADSMDLNSTLVFDEYKNFNGGKGENQALTAAKLGANSYIVSAVGNDQSGKDIIKALSEKGVNTSNIKISNIYATGLTTIFTMKGSSYYSVNVLGANNDITPDQVEKVLADEKFDMVLMQMEMPMETVYRTYEVAKAMDTKVIFDAGPAKAVSLERLKGIFIISPNEAETEALTGVKVKTESDALRASQILFEKAEPEYVVLKLGGMGAYLYTKEGKGEIFPATDDPCVDSTGAGDTFTAAMMIQLCKGMDIRDAIKYANVAAGICVSRYGGLDSIPSAEEIAQRIK